MANESVEMVEMEETHQQQEDKDYVLNGDGDISAFEDNSSSVSTKHMTPGGQELTTKCATSRLYVKNLTSTKSYKLDEDFEPVRHKSSEESNIEQIPARSNNSNSCGSNSQEPSSVIIDTNAILSRREPVPMNHFSGSGSSVNSPTITLIPQTSSSTPAKLTPPTSTIASSSPSTSQTYMALSELTDDMFVVEAASFVVPYLYEKPPVTELKTFVKELENQILKQAERRQKRGGDDNDAMEIDDVKDDGEEVDLRNRNFDPLGDPKESNSYFESSVGQFFMDIGFNQVQEYGKSDLQDHFKSPLKTCEYCNFKTESLVVMANHLETPHVKNKMYMCNFCPYKVLSPHDILSHMKAKHGIKGRLEEAPALHQCPNCLYESKQKSQVTRHLVSCMRKFKPEKNLEPPVDWEPPAKMPTVPMRRGRGRPRTKVSPTVKDNTRGRGRPRTKVSPTVKDNTRGRGRPRTKVSPTVKDNTRGRGRPRTKASPIIKGNTMMNGASNMVHKQAMSGGSVLISTNHQLNGNQVYQQQSQKNEMHQPSISIIPLGPSVTPSASMTSNIPSDTNSEIFVAACEICDNNIRDWEQLRSHMQWVHMVKLLPKRVYNCQKCLFRFFTDQGLDRHLLGDHGLVSFSMWEASNKNKDAGRCLVCGVNQMKLLDHLERDHGMVLKPVCLLYKCQFCTASFSTHKQYENHLYSTHSASVGVKPATDKKIPSAAETAGDSLMKPFQLNNETIIIPLPAKASTSKKVAL